MMPRLPWGDFLRVGLVAAGLVAALLCGWLS